MKRRIEADSLEGSCQIELFCDYSLVGLATEFPLIVTPDEHARLSVGSFVVVLGDSVPDRLAEVFRIEKSTVFVRVIPHRASAA